MHSKNYTASRLLPLDLGLYTHILPRLLLVSAVVAAWPPTLLDVYTSVPKQFL